MAAARQFELVIGSRFENLELVDVLMQAVIDHFGLGEADGAGVVVAAREAAANAVRHAGREDERRRVHIGVHVDGDELLVEVGDSGPGFDPASVRDPLAPENLLRPCGRGIFLMRSYMDEVDFAFPERGGTVVSMRRRLGGRRAGPDSAP